MQFRWDAESDNRAQPVQFRWDAVANCDTDETELAPGRAARMGPARAHSYTSARSQAFTSCGSIARWSSGAISTTPQSKRALRLPLGALLPAASSASAAATSARTLPRSASAVLRGCGTCTLPKHDSRSLGLPAVKVGASPLRSSEASSPHDAHQVFDLFQIAPPAINSSPAPRWLMARHLQTGTSVGGRGARKSRRQKMIRGRRKFF